MKNNGLHRNKKTGLITNTDEAIYASFLQKREALIKTKNLEEQVDDLTKRLIALEQQVAKLNV